MSHENVELVGLLQPDPGVDVAALFRDEDAAGELAEKFAGFLHPDCECVLHYPGAEPTIYKGLEGWRMVWRDWLAPWASYRTEVEDLLDAGDRVVALVRDYGRREPGAPEVEMIAAAVWTVRERKIARAEFYTHRSEALDSVGLRG
jgi:ketosteroid isomerase-like protein